MSRLATLVVTTIVLASATTAQVIIPLEQERQVAVRLEPVEPNDPNVQVASTQTFEPWQAEVFLEDNGSIPPRRVSCSHFSSASGTLLEACGAAQVDSFWVWPLVAEAQHRYRWRFAVPQPATVELVGDLAVEFSAPEPPSGSGHVFLDIQMQLNQVAGDPLLAQEALLDVFHYNWSPHFINDQPVLSAFELTPGVYELSVTITLNGDGTGWYPFTHSEAAYVISAEFAEQTTGSPGAADLDGDGDVDILDFAIMQRALTGPGPN